MEVNQERRVFQRVRKGWEEGVGAVPGGDKNASFGALGALGEDWEEGVGAAPGAIRTHRVQAGKGWEEGVGGVWEAMNALPGKGGTDVWTIGWETKLTGQSIDKANICLYY